MINQEGLEKDDDLSKRLRDKVRPTAEILSVPRTSNSIYAGRCYDDVRTAVRERGGSAQLGWLLSHLPGHFGEALHHAVWRSADGQLEDVSGPPFRLLNGPSITFVCDDEELGRVDPQVPSTFIQVDREKGTSDYIAAMRRRMEIGKPYIEFREMFRTCPSPDVAEKINRLAMRFQAVTEIRRVYEAQMDKGDFKVQRKESRDLRKELRLPL